MMVTGILSWLDDATQTKILVFLSALGRETLEIDLHTASPMTTSSQSDDTTIVAAQNDRISIGNGQ